MFISRAGHGGYRHSFFLRGSRLAPAPGEASPVMLGARSLAGAAGRWRWCVAVSWPPGAKDKTHSSQNKKGANDTGRVGLPFSVRRRPPPLPSPPLSCGVPVLSLAVHPKTPTTTSRMLPAGF